MRGGSWNNTEINARCAYRNRNQPENRNDNQGFRLVLRAAHVLPPHESATQVLPTACGIPWLGFVVYPTHRLLKRRNAVNFTRRLERNLDQYQAGRISFAELDAGVQGWINHVRFADTWGLREHIFSKHPIPRREG